MVQAVLESKSERRNGFKFTLAGGGALHTQGRCTGAHHLQE